MLSFAGIRSSHKIGRLPILYSGKCIRNYNQQHYSTKSNSDIKHNALHKSSANSVHSHSELTDTHSHSHSSAHSHSGGHSHSHTHSATGELLSTGNVRNPAVRITLVGFVANIGMAVLKGVGGVVFHSQSLIADAIHAVSDLFSDVMTLCTVSVANKKPTALFPNGYGRIETIGAFGVSSMLLFAGASMGWSSLMEICAALNIDVSFANMGALLGHSHSHSHTTVDAATKQVVPAEWSAAGIALGSIAIKETLYQATKKVAEQQNSPVLYANAWHHRIDCLVSVVAVISISAGQMFQLAWVDPLGGLLVSGVIIKAGWRPTVDSVLELSGCVKPVTGTPVFDEFQQLARTELSVIAPSYEIAKCTLEPYGSTYVGSVQLKNVDNGAEEVAQKLKESLMKMEHMRQVYIRI